MKKQKIAAPIFIIIINLHPCSEHRPQTNNFQPRLSWAILESSPHECPIFAISFSTHLLQVSLGLFCPRFPCGFHFKECLEILAVDFLKVWPIHRHLLLLISTSIGTWLALSQRSSFLTLSIHLTPRILRMHRFTKVWSFLITVAVAFQVSHPYKRTDLTHALKSLSLVFLEIFLALHTFPSCVKAARAFPILAFTSTSVPPFPSAMLPR